MGIKIRPIQNTPELNIMSAWKEHTDRHMRKSTRQNLRLISKPKTV